MSLQQYAANVKAFAPLQGESVKLTSLARSAHKALTPQQLVCTDDMRAASFLVIFALATPLVKGEVVFFGMDQFNPSLPKPFSQNSQRPLAPEKLFTFD